MPDKAVIAPGGTIGILGGGQLGRMTALAAAELGYDCHIYTPEADSPAGRTAAAETVAPYDDTAALDAFAGAVDVVTFEFENIPFETVQRLAEKTVVRPGWEPLRVAQDRREEKSFLNARGLPTPPWAAVESREGLTAAVEKIGRPGVLKSARHGYDGKGQTKIDDATDLDEAWDAVGREAAVFEGFVDFACEIAVVVARGIDGKAVPFDVTETVQANHMLAEALVPARIDAPVAAEATRIAIAMTEALDVTGLLTVEMFVTRGGDVLVNEMAPRPHNSGHWTQDGCGASQFTQFVRAVTGMPLADPSRHSDIVMKNLVGDEIDGWAALAADPAACIHLYGKREARAGRKMGHVTWLKPKTT